jgi:hypothetical protein
MRLNKLFLSAIATTLACAGYADTIQEDKEISMSMNSKTIDNQSSMVENRLCKLENQINGFKTHNPVYGDMQMDFLYWRGGGNDWFYGITQQPSNGAVGKILRQELNWKPGARLNIDFSGLYDWTMGLMWTYYHNKTSVHTTKNIQDVFSQISVTDLLAKSKLTYNTLDLNFGSNFRLNKTFEFNPFFGVRGIGIKRNIFHDVQGISNQQFSHLIMDNSYKFYGCGPRLGLKAFCNFGDTGLSFLGSFSSGIMLGKAKILQSVESQVQGRGGPGTISDAIKDLKTTIQLLAGVNYKYCFDHDSKAVFLQFAWEHNYYWDFSDSFFFVGTAGGNDGGLSVSENYEALILYGMNFGIGFEY